MLHISKDFQRRNLEERLLRPAKRGKYDPSDITERTRWGRYMEAFEIALKRTSTDTAPWYCLPGDDKRYARLVVRYLLLDALRDLRPEWPGPSFDVAEELRRLGLS